MRRYILIYLVFSIWVSLALGQDNWRTLKGTHFIVYYKSASDDFIRKLIDQAEEDYDRIAEKLGFRRYNFWLWDNRAKIYIYDNAEDFQAATAQPSWSGGSVSPRDKIIHSFPYAQKFFDTILPHEMGHIIFREFVGFDNSAIPLWLDEGVASFQEDFRSVWAKELLRKALSEHKLIGLSELSALNPHLMRDTSAVDLFYAEAVSVIDYLIKRFGQDTFVSFCQALRDKKDLKKAIASVYPFSNLNELDKAWQKYLRNE